MLQKLLGVLDELESLKPEFQRRLSEHNEAEAASQLPEIESTSYGLQTSSLEWPPVNNRSLSMNVRQVLITQMLHIIDISVCVLVFCIW